MLLTTLHTTCIRSRHEYAN